MNESIMLIFAYNSDRRVYIFIILTSVFFLKAKMRYILINITSPFNTLSKKCICFANIMGQTDTFFNRPKPHKAK